MPSMTGRAPGPSHSFLALLLALGLAATTIVVIASSRYGIGLSPDSVVYISAARSLAAGEGCTVFDGHPLVFQPPLYPALLALPQVAFGADPLRIARFISALALGLITILTGLLGHRFLQDLPYLAILGALAVPLSLPLFQVSVMAWSEPLFILFVLLFFLVLESIRDGAGRAAWFLLAAALAGACLTRYTGVALVPVAVVLALVRTGGRWWRRLAAAGALTLATVLPLGLWILRNLALAGTPFGERAASAFSLGENLGRFASTILPWFLPRRIAAHPLGLALLAAAVIFVLAAALRAGRGAGPSILRRLAPYLGFGVIYTGLVVASATFTTLDTIDDRLLSPLYLPLILAILVLAERAVAGLKMSRHPRLAYLLPALAVVLWSLHPMAAIATGTTERIEQGAGGYNTTPWRESGLVRYLQVHPLADSHPVYSNAPDALYILVGLKAKKSPARTWYNSPVAKDDLPGLEGTWPDISPSYLVWFSENPRRYLYSVDELATISTISPLATLPDGTVYRVSASER